MKKEDIVVKVGDVFTDDWGILNRIDEIKDGVCMISAVDAPQNELFDRVSVDYAKACILYDNDKRA